MVPDLTLLVSIVLGLFMLSLGGAGSLDAVRSAGGTAAVVLVVMALARMGADKAIRAVERRDAEGLVRAGRSTSLWPFLGWLTVLLVFRWGDFVAAAIPRTWFLLPHLAMFAPLFLMVGAGWSAVGRVESRFAPGATGRGAIRRGLVRNGIVLLPMAVLIVVGEAIVVLAELGVPAVRRALLVHQAFRDVEVVVVLLLSTALGYWAPSLVRRFLKTRPMAPGPIRTALERQCAIVGVRAKDLLVWETHGRVLNALVVGLTGRTRYVIVSDGLLSKLPLDEVLAVVSHEAGHAKLMHLQTFLVVSIATILLVRSAEEAIGPWATEETSLVLSLVSLGVFWFGMLGWLSRRFERQADVFGAEHAAASIPGAPAVAIEGVREPVPAGAAAMINALEHVVTTPSSAKSHRHGSIEERTRFLAGWATDPAARAGYVRNTRNLRLGLAAFAIVAVAATALRVPAGLERGDALLAFEEGGAYSQDAMKHRRAARADDATAAFARARASFVDAAAKSRRRPEDATMRMLASVATLNVADIDLRHLSRLDDARRGLEAALSLAKAAGPDVDAAFGFQARIDLGRLALREPDAAAGLAKAKRYLAEAERYPAIVGEREEYRDARRRLLRAAIRLRDADPEVAVQARRDLERQAQGTREGDGWKELAGDAREELALAAAR